MRRTRMAALLAAALLAGAHAQAQAENYQWDSMAIGGGGFVSGIVTSKTERGVIYARTDVGGAYRWDANRQRWQSMMDWVSEGQTGFLGVESLAVDPKNAANVYLLAGISYFNNGKSAILRSTDYGKTFDIIDVTAQFKVHGNGMGRGAGERLQVDPGNSSILYTGTRRNGLFKSLDAGSTWQRLAGLDLTSTPNDVGIGFVVLDPTSVENGSAQRLFVGVSRFDSVGPNLYFSYDGGESFVPVEGGPTGLMPQRAVMTPDGQLYITYANGAGPHAGNNEPVDRGQIWQYDAAGGNWTNVTPAGVTSAFGGISVDPANPKRLVASTINTWRHQQGNAYGDRFYLSKDGGRNWTDVVQRGFKLDTGGIDWVRNHAIHWAGSIEFDPFDTKSVLVTSGNGLFKNNDIDASDIWSANVAGLEETVPMNAVSVAGRPLVSTVLDYDGFMHAEPDAYGPIHNPQMGSTTGLAVAALNSNVMARSGWAMYYSTNGGASWTRTATMNGNKGQLALSSDGAVLIHSPENSSTHYRSTDFGTSWTPIAGLSARSGKVVADTVNPLKFYSYDNGRFLVSTDGGISFSVKSTIAAGGSKIIRTIPGREGDIWVCLYGGGLVHSTNSGASFVPVPNVAGCGAVGYGKAAPGLDYPTLYMWGGVGSVHGMLRSLDKGATWVRINDDAHEYGGPANGQFVVGDMNTYGLVYMSTAGRGIVYGRSSDAGDVVVTPVDSTPPLPPPQQRNKCEYLVTASWQGGYNAAIRITNNRTQAITGWTVNWRYTDNSQVQASWNAAVTGTAPSYAATANQSWNTTIHPGSWVEFGITVAGAAIPTVTGDVCN